MPSLNHETCRPPVRTVNTGRLPASAPAPAPAPAPASAESYIITLARANQFHLHVGSTSTSTACTIAVHSPPIRAIVLFALRSFLIGRTHGMLLCSHAATLLLNVCTTCISEVMFMVFRRAIKRRMRHGPMKGEDVHDRQHVKEVDTVSLRISPIRLGSTCSLCLILWSVHKRSLGILFEVSHPIPNCPTPASPNMTTPDYTISPTFNHQHDQKMPNLFFFGAAAAAAGYLSSFCAALSRFFSLLTLKLVNNTIIMPKKSRTKLARTSQIADPK